MIIPALIDYYDRLADDPEVDVAPYGFSRQKVSFEVVLKRDGTLHEFTDFADQEGKRRVPKQLVVPGQSKPSGSGINPCFLWDSAQYMLGFRPDDPSPDRTRRCFKAFRDRHLELEAEIDDEAYGAVCAFLKSWDPDHADEHEALAQIADRFGVFRIVGAQEHVHERPAVVEYWNRVVREPVDDQTTAPSLVSGRVEPVARLHEPKIKGVQGGQTSGAPLVTFNAGAFESYGKDQGANAPVGVEDAFKYCTALNRLTGDRKQRARVGDATVVFWSNRPNPVEADFGALFDDRGPEKDEQHLRAFFERLKRGLSASELENPDAPFYALALSPNAGRVSVRFWLAGTVRQFADRLSEHVRALEMVGEPPEAPPPSIRRLVGETAPPSSGWADEDRVPPALAGEVARAVMSGLPYPRALLSGVVRRIRSEGFTHPDKRKDWRSAAHRRAAIVRACLTRDARRNHTRKEITVSLDPDRQETSYQLGRLLAAFERVQEDSTDREIKSTIKDRFYSAFSATPVSVFSRLVRTHQYHMESLHKEWANRKSGKGRKMMKPENAEKMVRQICDRIDALPTHLSLDDQGLFALGYYHQRQSFFEKKEPAAEAAAE